MAQAISITEGKFVYNSIGYFSNNADNVVLGTWGKKKSPLGGPHYVQDEGRIPAQHMQVRKATSVTIDFSQTSQTDIGATILVPGVGKLGPAALIERGRDGQLALLLQHWQATVPWIFGDGFESGDASAWQLGP